VWDTLTTHSPCSHPGILEKKNPALVGAKLAELLVRPSMHHAAGSYSEASPLPPGLF
jgi:hypothetical protein